MPIKFGPTIVAKDRKTGQKTTTNNYIKNKSIEELITAYNKPVIPKLRQKVKNEIVRRNKEKLLVTFDPVSPSV